MANWGTKDYVETSADVARAEELRAQLHARGRVTQFMYNHLVERGYNQALVQIWCVRHAAWQQVRLSMKGINTVDKLDVLHAYWAKNYGKLGVVDGHDVCAIQVGNYLGALRRGGQLDDENRIRKAR